MPDVTLTLRSGDAFFVLQAIREHERAAFIAYRPGRAIEMQELVDACDRVTNVIRDALRPRTLDLTTPAAGMAEDLEAAE